MPAFNQCIMVGNLTRDPQLSFTLNQTAVADFALAINRKWRGGDGAKRESVCFIDARAFGKLAEIVGKYMKTGSCALVQGYLDFEQWNDKEGNKHSKHRLVAQSVQFLTSNGSKVEAGNREPIPDSDIPF